MSADRAAAPAAIGGALAVLYVFWGVTFLAIRVAVLDGVPPLVVIAIRCAGGAALLYAWMLARGDAVRASAAEWRTAVVAGAFLFLGCHAVMAWAERRVSSGEAALFLTTIPLWLVVLSALRERVPPNARIVAGLAVGTLGIAVLAAGDTAWSGTLADRVALVLCGLSWAIGSLIARHGARPASAVRSTAMQLAAGGAILTLAALVTGDAGRWAPADATPRAALSLAFLVVCGTVLGFGAYTWLLRVTTPAAVGSYAYVNPVVALALAWAVGDGELSPRTALAAGLVLAAVFLTRDTSGAAARRLAPRGARG